MIDEKEITTRHYLKLSAILGTKDLPANIQSPFDFIILANEGISIRILLNFSEYFKLSKNIVSELLNISEPTLYRWTKANKKLERNFSVKLFEIADLFLYGEELFGNRDDFFKWLNLPNEALGGLEPKELIEIPGGVSKVKDVLGRIEYGVYS